MPLSRKTACALLISVLAMSSSGADANADIRLESAIPSMSARYNLAWGGISIADLYLGTATSNDLTTHEIEIRTKGLVDFVAPYHAELRSQHAATAMQQQADFDATFSSRSSVRTTLIDYAAEDGAITHLELRKRGEIQKSKVPENLWSETYDVLRLLAAARSYVARDLLTGTPVKLGGFDGRKRFDLTIVNLGTGDLTIDKGQYSAQRLKILIDPIAGYDEEDLEKYGDDRWVEAWVTNDGRAVPLRLKIVGSSLTGSVTLTHDCSLESNACKLDSGE